MSRTSHSHLFFELRGASRCPAAAVNAAAAAVMAPPPARQCAPTCDAAALLVPLARGATAGAYRLPSAMGMMAGALPGYRDGLDPFAHDDPTCELPEC